MKVAYNNKFTIVKFYSKENKKKKKKKLFFFLNIDIFKILIYIFKRYK